MALAASTEKVPPPTPTKPGGRRPAMGWRRLSGLKGFGFTAPFFAGFILVFLAPFVYALVQAFFAVRRSGNGLGGSFLSFVGFENFARGFMDEQFWSSMARVGTFALIQIPIMLCLSLLMALLLDMLAGRSARFFRVGLLVPYMIPAIVATLVWLYLYSPRLGPLTKAGEALGANINFFAPELLWVSIGNLLTWAGIGYNMLILYGALRSVPRDLFEAARLDGAGELRIAWSIKIPYVRSSLVLTGMLSIIHMLQIFAEPLVFRVSSPETVTASFTPIMMIYNLAFTEGNYQYAAALSVILALVVGASSAIFYRLTNRRSA